MGLHGNNNQGLSQRKQPREHASIATLGFLLGSMHGKDAEVYCRDTVLYYPSMLARCRITCHGLGLWQCIVNASSLRSIFRSSAAFHVHQPIGRDYLPACEDTLFTRNLFDVHLIRQT